jgi:hypothetical protein
MAATLHSIEPETTPVNATISRTMESLRTYVGMSVPELQRALGLKPGTYFNRKNGSTDWTAVEVKRAADALGVDVATLYNGLALPGSVPSEGVTRKYPDEGAVIIPFPLPLAA